jgi:hypothetical protein
MGISGLVGSSSRAVATVAPPCLAPLVVSALCRVRALSTCSAAPVAEDSPTSLHPAQKWAIDIMNKQKSLLMRVSPSDYRQAPKHIGSSMGEHLRHTLDHFSTLLEDRKTGTVNYDEKRQRGNIVEQDPVVALANLEKLKKTIKYVDRKLKVISCASNSASGTLTWSLLCLLLGLSLLRSLTKP